VPDTRQQIYATTFIRRQHDQIRELFDAVERAEPDARREAFEPLVRLLAVHETAEEIVIYPMAKGGEAGKEIVEQRKAEENAAKKMLVDLEKMDPATGEFATALASFRREVFEHAEAEELEIFPLLTEVADTDELKRMTTRLEMAEAMAPTHPHKTAPESSFGNLVTGPFVAMVDRVRDAIRDAGSERSS
jgi:hemerythrin superfamily protein